MSKPTNFASRLERLGVYSKAIKWVGKSIDFEAGDFRHKQETELRIAVPNRDEAWQIVKNILKQLEENDDGSSGIAIVLHGKILGQD